MTQKAPPPARPLYERVIREVSLRGWTKTELSERSGVARTTIDNWSTNRRKPQPKAVNAVADVLGIDREEAHVLAGIVTPEHPDALLRNITETIRRAGLTPDQQEAVIAAVEQTLRDDHQRAASDPSEPSRRAG